MDIFTRLSNKSDYSTAQLQAILGGWVLGSLTEGTAKVDEAHGHVSEDDYTKQSIYSLLYSLYSAMGTVKSETGREYELTFNTWGYAWPKSWGPNPNTTTDPQRFGQNAYTGLYEFEKVKEYVAAREGKVHVVEMGCGTGAGAHHVTKYVLPRGTYECVDMQRAAIDTCNRKFVPELGGRLKATHADCTNLPIEDEVADLVAVCETHVTECGGMVTAEDAKFFKSAYRLLKPGGFLVWGNAIPADTWDPCIDYLQGLGMDLIEVRDVTPEACLARIEDERRVDAYVDQCLERFHAFKIPFLGPKKRMEAELAMKNFYRNPGTNLYADMKTRADTYQVVCLQKPA